MYPVQSLIFISVFLFFVSQFTSIMEVIGIDFDEILAYRNKLILTRSIFKLDESHFVLRKKQASCTTKWVMFFDTS
jgi:hypothetical protein